MYRFICDMVWVYHIIDSSPMVALFEIYGELRWNSVTDSETPGALFFMAIHNQF